MLTRRALLLQRDSIYYQWLRGHFFLPIVGFAAMVLRIKSAFAPAFSEVHNFNSSTVHTIALPPSLLSRLLFILSPSPLAPQYTPYLTLFHDILALLILYNTIQAVRHLCRLQWHTLNSRVKGVVFNAIRQAGPVRRKLEAETRALEASLERSLRPPGWNKGSYTEGGRRSLPTEGLAAEALLREMEGFVAKEERKWKDGWVSGAVYGGEEAVGNLMGRAVALYALANPLHPDLWPSVMKFESEVCGMVCRLVDGGDPDVVGCLTSGGTESILLAVKASRDRAWAEKGVGKAEGEIVACVSAHAAVHKAADLMGLRLILVPMDQTTYQLDLSAMEAAITASTVLLYASAPTFAQGAIDDVAGVSRLGGKYGVSVHVDCCLGGFILPFARRAGFSDLPTVDFALPGVTSMSIDTHKYGYAAKGTSVLCYRSKAVRRYQYFCFPSWTGGLYVTPTLAGSRPGALSAACWAALMHVGESGYIERAGAVLRTARRIAQGVREGIPGIRLLGTAPAMIVCVGGTNGLDIYGVGDRMSKKGWNLNSLQSPPGLHLCCTLRHVGREESFLQDLREAAGEALEEIREGKTEKDKGSIKGNAAIYGMAATLPAGPVNEMLGTYTDCVLKS